MHIYTDNGDLMEEAEPIKMLPAEYELDRYTQGHQLQTADRNVKAHLFSVNGMAEWGEASSVY